MALMVRFEIFHEQLRLISNFWYLGKTALNPFCSKIYRTTTFELFLQENIHKMTKEGSQNIRTLGTPYWSPFNPFLSSGKVPEIRNVEKWTKIALSKSFKPFQVKICMGIPYLTFGGFPFNTKYPIFFLVGRFFCFPSYHYDTNVLAPYYTEKQEAS